MKILRNSESLQKWVENEIDTIQHHIDDDWQPQLNSKNKQYDALREQPPSPERDEQEQKLTRDMAKLEAKLSSARTEVNRYLLLKSVVQFLPGDRFQSLAALIGVLVIGVGIKGVFEYCQESLVGSAVNRSLFDLRNRCYRNVIHLDVSNFGEEGTAELMSRFTNDTEMLGVGMKTLFGKVVAEPLKAFCCVIAAAYISWQLTLIFLVLVPIAIYIVGKVGRMMKRATRRLLERMSSIYKLLQETFQSIRVVKAFTMEPYERRRFQSATRDYYRKSNLLVNLDAISGPVLEFLGVAIGALALLAGAYLVLTGETHFYGLRLVEYPLDVEGLLTLYGCLAAIADPVRKLSSVYTKLQSGAAAADRIYDYMDRHPRVQPNSHGTRLSRLGSGLEFRDVCFSYEAGGRTILSHVNLSVRAGETVAIVGRNGCGKTTLLGLIPRFYDPDHGSVLVDGIDIRKANLRTLRQQIGLVTQDTILFDDTIYNNIAYGNRHARREEVEAAAKQTYCHDFILKLPQGYDTRIGELGGKLSGGQKQRLALARAVLRDPSILILDEFTSQIDAESEALIHKALHEFIRHRTTFVITHRLSTLEIASRIVLLEDGRIEAIGTHAELLGTCPAYQRLHDALFLRQVA
jgi:ATP-binding cassette subfamily B protein/subfamily B ATP-binding cassette protein MsbA